MKHLLPLVTDENKRLFWAFGLVAGSWAISLMISGVVWFVGQTRPVISEKITVKLPILLNSPSESAFRTYVREAQQASLQQELPLTTLAPEIRRAADSLPAELPETFSGNDQYQTAYLEGEKVVLIDSKKVGGYLVFDESVTIVDSRMVDGSILIVASTPVKASEACPLVLAAAPQPITIPCNQILHWNEAAPVTTAYSLLKLNPDSGNMEVLATWVGNQEETGHILAEDAIYLTQPVKTPDAGLLLPFLRDIKPDTVNQETLDKVLALETMTLGAKTKEAEAMSIVNDWADQLSDSERLQWNQQFDRQFEQYKQANIRSITRTFLAKIPYSAINSIKTTAIPGLLIGSAAVDESKQILQTATSVGSEVEVRVLDKDLNEKGSLTVPQTTRPADIRFVNGLAYLSTYVTNEPIALIDLRNESNIIYAGETNLASQMMHLTSLGDNLLLILSASDNRTTVGLFDSSDPKYPRKIADQTVNEYWSDLEGNLANLKIDSASRTLFLPGKNGGYIFQWSSESLNLIRKLSAKQENWQVLTFGQTAK